MWLLLGLLLGLLQKKTQKCTARSVQSVGTLVCCVTVASGAVYVQHPESSKSGWRIDAKLHQTA